MKELPTALELMRLLSEIKPEYAVTSPAVRQWWETEALPYLKDSALSQLRRTGEFRPCLIGFMETGAPGVVDLDKAAGGFGDARSKDATAFVQRVAAMVPGTRAAVFCCETWVLAGKTDQELGDISDHPDRQEAMMFSMLHFEHGANQMMQLMTMCMQVKVLGANVSPTMWRETKFGAETTSDPMVKGPGGMSFSGRFVPSDPEAPAFEVNTDADKDR